MKTYLLLKGISIVILSVWNKKNQAKTFLVGHLSLTLKISVKEKTTGNFLRLEV